MSGEQVTNQTNEVSPLDAFSKAEEQINSDVKAVASNDTPAGEEVSNGETPELSGEPEATPDGEAQEGLDIDPEVLESCRSAGMTDEVIASLSPEFLADIRAELDELVNPVPKQEPKAAEQSQTTQEAIDELKFNLDPDIHGKELVDAINKLAGRINQDGKVFSEERTKLENERSLAFNQRIDANFDRCSKDLPALGNSSRLDKKSASIRQEVFAVANAISLQRKIPVERAIPEAVAMYKNKDGNKEAQQTIIDKLNKNEKRMINKPTRRLSQQSGPRKFANDFEKAEYKMAHAEQEAGLS